MGDHPFIRGHRPLGHELGNIQHPPRQPHKVNGTVRRVGRIRTPGERETEILRKRRVRGRHRLIKGNAIPQLLIVNIRMPGGTVFTVPMRVCQRPVRPFVEARTHLRSRERLQNPVTHRRCRPVFALAVQLPFVIGTIHSKREQPPAIAKVRSRGDDKEGAGRRQALQIDPSLQREIVGRRQVTRRRFVVKAVVGTRRQEQGGAVPGRRANPRLDGRDDRDGQVVAGINHSAGVCPPYRGIPFDRPKLDRFITDASG